MKKNIEKQTQFTRLLLEYRVFKKLIWILFITSVFYVNAGATNNKVNFSNKVEISDLTTNNFVLNQPPVEQKKIVKGTISDANGQPIPGASVLIEGTNKGFISDGDGNYSIEAESQNVLVFSFLGYEILCLSH